MKVRLRGNHRGPAGWEIVPRLGVPQPVTTERLLNHVQRLRERGKVEQARALFAELAWLALIGAAWREESGPR